MALLAAFAASEAVLVDRHRGIRPCVDQQDVSFGHDIEDKLNLCRCNDFVPPSSPATRYVEANAVPRFTLGHFTCHTMSIINNTTTIIFHEPGRHESRGISFITSMDAPSHVVGSAVAELSRTRQTCSRGTAGIVTTMQRTTSHPRRNNNRTNIVRSLHTRHSLLVKKLWK